MTKSEKQKHEEELHRAELHRQSFEWMYPKSSYSEIMSMVKKAMAITKVTKPEQMMVYVDNLISYIHLRTETCGDIRNTRSKLQEIANSLPKEQSTTAMIE